MKTSPRIAHHHAVLLLAALVFGLRLTGVCGEQKTVQTPEFSAVPKPSASASRVIDPTTPIEDRLKTVHALGNNLSAADLTSFYGFLTATPGPQEQNLPGLRVVKNDLLRVLEQQSAPPPDLTRLMAAMYQNPIQDPVTRDYAVQHMAVWYEHGAPDAPRAKEQIRTVLQQAVRENSSIAGTALLGLHRIINSGASPQNELLDNEALRMATSPETDPSARITAVQVCAERKLAEALPVIEALARTPGPTALRISAIGALGRLGGADDAALLRQLAGKADEALRPAIAGALQRLEPSVISQETF